MSRASRRRSRRDRSVSDPEPSGTGTPTPSPRSWAGADAKRAASAKAKAKADARPSPGASPPHARMDPILSSNPADKGETATVCPDLAPDLNASAHRPQPDEGWLNLEERQTRLIHSLAEIVSDPHESQRHRLGAINALIRLDEQIRKLRQEAGASTTATETAGEAAIRLLQATIATADDDDPTD